MGRKEGRLWVITSDLNGQYFLKTVHMFLFLLNQKDIFLKERENVSSDTHVPLLYLTVWLPDKLQDSQLNLHFKTKFSENVFIYNDYIFLV